MSDREDSGASLPPSISTVLAAVLTRAKGPERASTAVVDTLGEHTYGDLAAASRRIARQILAHLDSGRAPGDRDGDGAEPRIAFRIQPGLGFAATLLGIWRAGGIAVPLCLSHPEPEMDYTIGDADAALLIADATNHEALTGLATTRSLPLLDLPDISAVSDAEPPASEADPDGDRRALILYTSGTTGRPKGVVLRHKNLRAQADMLLAAWAWRPTDRMLNVLPLHHTHGLVNGLLCALAAGATWETLPRFNAEAAWSRLASGEITVFMGVPTVYVRLLAAYDEAPDPTRRPWAEGARGLRLMISGSAALPVPVLERWREVTSHTLLERYGMTEIGMALSNPLDGERRPGMVGTPLPGVEIRRVPEAEEDAPVDVHQTAGPEEPAEVLVRGPAVFSEYWRRPEATQEAFVGRWFRTGDIMVIEDGAYRILGRSSVDILKSGGYKISALEIEAVLRTHPMIRDCAVVGVPDPEWGQRVAAVVELTEGDNDLSLDEFRTWASKRLAPYKVPRVLRVLDGLPRNPLGKVLKPEATAILCKPS